jgi:hypothetical protein
MDSLSVWKWLIFDEVSTDQRAAPESSGQALPNNAVPLYRNVDITIVAYATTVNWCAYATSVIRAPRVLT